MCIAVVLATGVQVLPSDAITLSWTHSVEKTRWEEDYRVAGHRLVIEEARIRSSGAGMDAPREARWSEGWWRYRPALEPLDEVVLANSESVPGYTVCWEGTCLPLQEIALRGDPVTLVAARCAGPRAQSSGR
jgi:hypothetical protein